MTAVPFIFLSSADTFFFYSVFHIKILALRIISLVDNKYSKDLGVKAALQDIKYSSHFNCTESEKTSKALWPGKACKSSLETFQSIIYISQYKY